MPDLFSPYTLKGDGAGHWRQPEQPDALLAFLGD